MIFNTIIDYFCELDLKMLRTVRRLNEVVAIDIKAIKREFAFFYSKLGFQSLYLIIKIISIVYLFISVEQY